MKTKAFLLLATIALLLFSSCRNTLDDYDYLYYGAWDSDKFYFEIYNDGYGYIEKYGLFGFNGEDAEVTIRNNRIIFDTPNRTKRFNIDVSPTFDEFTGEVFMVLDGREYFKLE